MENNSILEGSIYKRPQGEIGLTALYLGDAGEFLALASESHVGLSPWIEPPQDMDAFVRLAERAKLENFPCYCIRLAGDGSLVGMVHFSQLFWGPFCSGYLSYWVAPRHQRQGYGAEALRLAVDLAFSELGLHRLEANIQPANVASVALVRSLGFVKEGYSERYLQINGVWMDHERWAIRQEIWPRREGDDGPAWQRS